MAPDDIAVGSFLSWLVRQSLERSEETLALHRETLAVFSTHLYWTTLFVEATVSAEQVKRLYLWALIAID